MLFKLRSHQFNLSEPFAEGHILTEGEATALNALRAENIRNLLSKFVVNEQMEGFVLGEEDLAKVRAKLEELEQNYQFNARPKRKLRAGTLEYEILTLAVQRVEERFRLKDRPKNWDELVAAEAARAEIREEAARRLEASRRVVSMGIEELLG